MAKYRYREYCNTCKKYIYITTEKELTQAIRTEAIGARATGPNEAEIIAMTTALDKCTKHDLDELVLEEVHE
ncbi:unnamed protein product [marine sediment metagenome]|uniref:Uncharacterized protein n=1 Tax=marine sediment metagenome TaxID=412755 RepID=X0Y4V1_9ZZZZ